MCLWSFNLSNGSLDLSCGVVFTYLWPQHLGFTLLVPVCVCRFWDLCDYVSGPTGQLPGPFFPPWVLDWENLASRILSLCVKDSFSYLCVCVFVFVCLCPVSRPCNLARVLSCWGLSSTRYRRRRSVRLIGSDLIKLSSSSCRTSEVQCRRLTCRLGEDWEECRVQCAVCTMYTVQASIGGNTAICNMLYAIYKPQYMAIWLVQ